MDKLNLRKECLSIRKNLPFKEADLESVFPDGMYEKVNTVFCYVSAKNEIGTKKIIIQMLEDKKTVCVPLCLDTEGNMICVKIDSLNDLGSGFFGIPEPKSREAFDKTKLDFVITPGVAFSSDGMRLGYGKGYYDRFLADISPYKVGLCHKELLTELKSEPHDVKMDRVAVF